MTLSLEWEPLQRLLDDGVEDLLAAHWGEVACDKEAIPLAPDWERAFMLQRAGALYTAAYRRDGRLIGYNAFHVTPHIHYRHSAHAVNDVVYLDPDERKGFAGVKLIRGTEALLREVGAVKIMYRCKTHVNIGHGEKTLRDLLVALGYRHDEDVLTRLL